MAFSGMEWVIVLLVIVILFFGGAKKIPEFAQSLGRARGEYERGKLEVEREIATQRAAAPPPPTTHACPKCGSWIGNDAAFCPKCGAPQPLAQGPAPAAAT